MQRRLGGLQAGTDDIGRLQQGIAQHVGQDDGAALGDGQTHEGAQRQGGDLMGVVWLVCRVFREITGLAFCAVGGLFHKHGFL
jgi:hypothetical protein